IVFGRGFTPRAPRTPEGNRERKRASRPKPGSSSRTTEYANLSTSFPRRDAKEFPRPSKQSSKADHHTVVRLDPLSALSRATKKLERIQRRWRRLDGYKRPLVGSLSTNPSAVRLRPNRQG